MLYYTCVILSVVTVCLLVTAIIKRFATPQASVYKIFAWTDGVLTVGVILYAIYDLFTDTGWFAGLFGVILLVYIVPVLLVLLLLDFICCKVNKKRRNNNLNNRE